MCFLDASKMENKMHFDKLNSPDMFPNQMLAFVSRYSFGCSVLLPFFFKFIQNEIENTSNRLKLLCNAWQIERFYIYSHTEHMQWQKRNTLSVTVVDYSLLAVIFIWKKKSKANKGPCEGINSSNDSKCSYIFHSIRVWVATRYGPTVLWHCLHNEYDENNANTLWQLIS